jgi:hypothetical protein
MEIYKTDFIPPDIDCFIFILNKNDYLSYIKYIEKLLKIKLPDKIFHKFLMNQVIYEKHILINFQ